MPDTYEVKITEHAEEALRELGFYIAFELMAPETAISYVSELRQQIKKLRQFPERIPLTKEKPWDEYGIHQMVVNNHYVYFWINESNLTVHVTDIIYNKRNQKKALNGMPME